MSALMHLLITASLIAVTTSGVGAATLGRDFVVAASGETCKATCLGASRTPGFLNSFHTGASTYMCAAKIDDEAWVPGYQTTEAHCSATYNGDTVNATTYACLCLSPKQTPGLQSSTGGQSCEQTCQQELQGRTGTAVRTDADLPLFACLPTSEAGKQNRFGVANDQSVPSTPSPAPTELTGPASYGEKTIPCNSAGRLTTDYSCFCTFEVQTSPSVSTAGRKLLL